MNERRAAFKAERAAMLEFCESLGPAEWRMDSRAAGWSIKDVVAHMAAGFHAMFSPSAVKLMRGNDIERANDDMVGARHDRPPAEVFGEYRRWSRAFGGLVPMLTGSPAGRIRMPLAELGRFPARLLVSAMVFDHHTHLRHDMAPALGRPIPATDANRMAAVCEWMIAVLDNQLLAAPNPALDRPVSLTLTGPGGGSWLVASSGEITAGVTEPAAAHITGVALEFPEWGTRRASWRDRDVHITGDAGYGAAFLDAVNIV